ncbi:MAG: aminodeoxychorismate synthase component I [Pseudomonadota bacterium]|nr:aminodeoxychorismate synthase component I [Pseudomonadota bacterium]
MPHPSSGNLVVHPLEPGIAAASWFEKFRHLPHPVLLASGKSTHGAARFDILTADPRCVLRTEASRTVVTHADGSAPQNFDEDPFAVLARFCSVGDVKSEPDLPFTGGAIGYFGYELLHGANGIDHSDKPALGVADMVVGIYDWALVVDNHTQRTVLVCRDVDAAREQQLLQIARSTPAAVAAPFKLVAPFTSNFTKAEYLERFQHIIDYILAGDCYQVNLTQCFTARCAGDSWAAWQHLQAKADAPFAAYLEDGTSSVLSFSPERFLRVTDGEVMTQPIKGTRPRSNEPLQDVAYRLDLEGSDKDRAENLMIVDLLRNDLGRVCATGSVSVENLFETQSFTNVHHLVSTIKGRLSDPRDVFKLMAACFPGGSITGTPKLRAMEIINELETSRRSVYCGVIAWIDRSGNMDSNITIRTLVRSGDRIHCWGGGGIVADSRGDEEYQESIDKISIFMRNLQQA